MITWALELKMLRPRLWFQTTAHLVFSFPFSCYQSFPDFTKHTSMQCRQTHLSRISTMQTARANATSTTLQQYFWNEHFSNYSICSWSSLSIIFSSHRGQRRTWSQTTNTDKLLHRYISIWTDCLSDLAAVNWTNSRNSVMAAVI
jgi:hypothetical protein